MIFLNKLILFLLLLIVNNIKILFAYKYAHVDNSQPYSNLDIQAKSSSSNCCENTVIIDSLKYSDGYLKEPPLYHDLHDLKNSKKSIECIYKFYGKPGERVQIYYETFDLYYPYDVNKFNKIDCRYSDSVCLKFYENSDHNSEDKHKDASKSESIQIDSHNYDLCNCINISFTPRQIISASNFLQIKFKTVRRSFDTTHAIAHSRKNYTGYLLRYQFTKDYGFNLKDSGELDKSGECKIYFYSINKKNGYFTSPNYPGLYPRDLECHYYFIGSKTEKVQITFHTFDIEGVDQCGSDTKSDYVELSNFQNRDRFYSRFCGINKPGTIISDGSFFHVSFKSNNVFDGKGFQASYYYIDTNTEQVKKETVPKEANQLSPKAASSVITTNDPNSTKLLQVSYFSNFIIFILSNVFYFIFLN
ncbi:unnamed protein product [Brachionus calyciflorus]|uniref:CUB domain-containing protein n=1 Tax=Brachionus calyciflorus TaxID=104777 RepID=A0A814FPK3_9BILA|nr:unnamed protein product [Brachionus calyciflorus]